MIFDKDKYYSHNFISSIVHRIKILFLKKTFGKTLRVNGESSIPHCSTSVDRTQLAELNILCHSSAFSMDGKDLMVDSFKCNSCGDCIAYKSINLTLISSDSDFQKRMFKLNR